MDRSAKERSFTFSLLALWLIATPFSFFCKEEGIFLSDLLSGVVLFVISSYGSFKPSQALFFPLFFLGLWLELAPLLFWAKNPAFFLNDTVVGAILLFTSFSYLSLSQEAGPSHSPSVKRHRYTIAFLASLCFLLARYLACFELGYLPNVFDPFFGEGTERVLHSNVSASFPLPDAGLGSVAYLLEAIFCLQGGSMRWKTSPWLVLIFGILAVPLGIVSMVLIALQPLVVGAWCSICLLIALLMLGILILSYKEVFAAWQYVRKGNFWKRLVGKV